MAARKRKRVPDVLWRLFGNRARTLADTILALIPPATNTEAACLCEGSRCLSCSGDESMSFLVRSDDSSDYRKLLSKCFVVVSRDVPPVPVFDPQCRWSQREIVRKSIEMILHEEPLSPNLICCNYDRDSRSSAAVEELTSSKWTVLLKRIGDALMMYLLKYTSIFLPLPRKKHNQIAGCFVGNMASKFSRCTPKYRSEPHPLADRGYYIKRKRVDIDEFPRKQLCSYTLGSEPSSSSIDFATTNGSTYVSEELPVKQSEGNSNKNTLKSEKRKREYRLRRQRKRRQLTVQGTPYLIPCGRNSCTNDTLALFSSSNQSGVGNIPHCFCCSVFQNDPRMKGNAEIDRKDIFYRLENSSSMLPRTHILHTLRPNDSGASVLFNNIFETFCPDKNAGSLPCCRSKNVCPTNSPCLYHSLKKLLKRLIYESKNCIHVRLLEKHCFVRSSYEDASRGAGTVPEGSNSANYLSTNRQDAVQSMAKSVQVANARNPAMIQCCLKNQIVSFIWAVCRRIVPLPLLGEQSNWRILRRNISKFIQLRRFEKFSLKECIYKLKISKFPIFSNKHTGCSGLGITEIARHAIFECWMFWFFAHLVSPLVQANFYVTESEHEKQEVLYYRKSTWGKLMNKFECMMGDGYFLLNEDSVRKILWKRSFGFSRARLLPKHKGFRLLSNLRSPSKLLVKPPSRIHSSQKSQRKGFCNGRGKYRFFKSVNNVLHETHAVLKGLWAKKPEKAGSSVFDYNGVYRKLLPFLFHLKDGSTSLPNVFIVVSDVSKAFDSVNHNKLLSVMKDVIFEDEFTLEKFLQVTDTRKSIKIDQHLILAHQDIGSASTRIRSRLRTQSTDSIVVKKEPSMKIRKEEISLILKEHITRNVLQLGNNFYHQHVGIPQGSILSSLLCSFYYGHMERNVVFPFLEKSSTDLLEKYHSPSLPSASGENHKMEVSDRGCEYLLLRFIDDFLFVSTSKKQASMFFSRLERGVLDYNCSMNREKYGLNFIMDSKQGCQSNRLHISKDGISFLPWSGLLVNCSTLEIQADYTRYMNSHLSSTLTVCRQGKVGQTLRTKLKSYLKPKCHPIFYDSNINSPEVVRLNIYQAFLLCAMKFICHLSNLSILPRFKPRFCINAIESSLRHMNRLIQRKMYSFQIDAAFRPKYDVEKKEVIWLGFYAFSRVLKKKQSRYKVLLRLIGSKLKAYGEVKNMSPELKYAIDEVHSSALWSIKY